MRPKAIIARKKSAKWLVSSRALCKKLYCRAMQRSPSLLCSLAARLWRSSAAPAAFAGLQPSAAAAAAACSSYGVNSSGLGQALQLVSCRWFSATAAAAPAREYIALNTLADNPGSTHSVSRAAPSSKGWAAAAACPSTASDTALPPSPYFLRCCRSSGWAAGLGRAWARRRGGGTRAKRRGPGAAPASGSRAARRRCGCGCRCAASTTRTPAPTGGWVAGQQSDSSFFPQANAALVS